MRKMLSWSNWSIGTKILLLFLGLSVLSMGVLGTVAIIHLRDLSKYALETSTTLGESAIQDSTTHLNRLGESLVNQKATDVARQVEMYLGKKPAMTYQEMRADDELRRIVVQSVGISGYTTLIDPVRKEIIIHKFPEQEKNLSSLSELIPSFWDLVNSSINFPQTSGYYDWIEVDQSISQKYASIASVYNHQMPNLTIWATTYINEFSLPAAETERDIIDAISESRLYINDKLGNLRDLFLIIFTILVISVIGIALLLSRIITRPIMALEQGANEIRRGNLNYKIRVNTKDELGGLASSFNEMSTTLFEEREKARRTAEENIEKERTIQDNLRLYVRKIGEAQEQERKRVARELHDQTLQDLIVVARQLDDLNSGTSQISAEEIRLGVQRILHGVRNFGQELRPYVLDDLGIVPAVKWLASNYNKEHVFSVETVFSGIQKQQIPEIDLMLFRVIQEALTNARKHSKATHILVKMDFSDHSVSVLVKDDGIGFSTPFKVNDLTSSGKLGLVGMIERVQLMEGQIFIDSQPGEGVTLRINVPLGYTL